MESKSWRNKFGLAVRACSEAGIKGVDMDVDLLGSLADGMSQDRIIEEHILKTEIEEGYIHNVKAVTIAQVVITVAVLAPESITDWLDALTQIPSRPFNNLSNDFFVGAERGILGIASWLTTNDSRSYFKQKNSELFDQASHNKAMASCAHHLCKLFLLLSLPQKQLESEKMIKELLRRNRFFREKMIEEIETVLTTRKGSPSDVLQDSSLYSAARDSFVHVLYSLISLAIDDCGAKKQKILRVFKAITPILPKPGK